MKWLLSIGVWAVTVVICGALGFIGGLFYTPSLDEGSHGMFIPVMFGSIGCYCGIPLGFVVAIAWLVRRSHQEKKDRELVRAMIDATDSFPVPLSTREDTDPNRQRTSRGV